VVFPGAFPVFTLQHNLRNLMALLETVILYCQLTLGIANPTATDIQSAELKMSSGSTTTSYVTDSPITCSTSTTGWDINEGN
jgi:hypothetical protein